MIQSNCLDFKDVMKGIQTEVKKRLFVPFSRITLIIPKEPNLGDFWIQNLRFLYFV